MQITKCDKCKRVTKERPVRIDASAFASFVELCVDCAEPVMRFIKRNKLISEEDLDRKLDGAK